MKNKPGWYTNDHDSTWERVKTAFRNDWEQTRHDFGSKTARDLDQDVDDTVKQAAGAEDGFDHHEQAFRFGHAANRQFRSQHATWNDDLDRSLRNDYGPDYDRDRSYIRHAYEYRYGSSATSPSTESRDEVR
ncbi:MAG TPA: hypothetical protein VEK11_12225 [Thermoanaerobaculia bacterium]|jgi:hypothetical protein|nr:hypothetical protein [Thermoanaerobaculia bacterium]